MSNRQSNHAMRPTAPPTTGRRVLNQAPGPQGLYDPQFEHEACGVGFVVHMKGRKSHTIVEQALQILVNLDHRGACGCEANTGDGAGILLQMPHEFFQSVCPAAGISLPAAKQYAAGLVYLPPDANERQACEKEAEKIVLIEGLSFLGWRTVPTNNTSLGDTAKASEPFMRQVFIGRPPGLTD